MHQTQKVLLKRLALQNNQKYAVLTRGYNFENNIVFHLNQLLENQHIEKKGSIYAITSSGIKAIYNYELSDLSEPGIKTFFCGFIASDDNGNYLLKGHPTAKINFFNLPSGRPVFGEKTETALVRLFKENTGVEVIPTRFKYIALHAKIVKTKEGEALFDDGQAMFKVKVNPTEKKSMKLLKGVNWYKIEEIEKLKNTWPEIEMCILKKEITPFASYEVVSNYKL